MPIDPNIPLSVTPHHAPNMLQMLLAVEDMRQRQRYGQDAEEDRAVRRDELKFRIDQLKAAEQAKLDEAAQKTEDDRQHAFVRTVGSLKARPPEERAARYPALIAQLRAADKLPSGPVPETWEEFGGDGGLDEFVAQAMTSEQFGAAFGPKAPVPEKKYQVKMRGPNGTTVEKLVTEAELMQGIEQPPAAAGERNPTAASLADAASPGDPLGALKILRAHSAPQGGGGLPAQDFVMRNGEVVPIQRGTAQRGDVPFDAVAARQAAENVGQGQDSPYLEERRIRNRESVAALMKKAGLRTTGVASLMSYLPATAARNFQAELDTLKANISFGELAEMRASSKTGGALGAISVRELELLGATLGGLDTGQSPAQFRSQLKKVQESLDRWQTARAEAKRVTSPGSGTAPVKDQKRTYPNGRTATFDGQGWLAD